MKVKRISWTIYMIMDYQCLVINYFLKNPFKLLKSNNLNNGQSTKTRTNLNVKVMNV
jgi:hypothetical protein